MSLPSCESVKPGDECPTCSKRLAQPVRRLDFVFTRQQAPLGLPLRGPACVFGCNPEMNTLLTAVNRAPIAMFQQTVAARTPAAVAMPQPHIGASYQQLQRGMGANAGASVGAGVGAGGGDSRMCRCNKPALARTVRKEGPNTGRRFFSCDACQFYEWEDTRE